MADFEFAFRRQLAERTAERRIVEEGVVTEAGGAARFVRDKAFHGAAEDTSHAISFDEGDDTHKASCSRVHPLEHLLQHAIVGGVGRVKTGEPSRKHTGSASERVYLDAGIVCKQEAWRVPTIVARLEQGILLEGAAVF